jgi:hypothetical protein
MDNPVLLWLWFSRHRQRVLKKYHADLPVPCGSCPRLVPSRRSITTTISRSLTCWRSFQNPSRMAVAFCRCATARPLSNCLNCNLVAHGPEPHHMWPGRGPAPLCCRDRPGYLDKLIKSLSRRPAVPYTCASTRKKKRYQRRRNGAPPRGENECPIRGAARMLEPVALRSSMPLSISGKPALPLPCPDTSRIVDHHDVQGIAVIGFGGSTKPQSCG